MSEWKETKIGLIPKDWEILPLSDLIEFTVDNRGKTAPTVEHKTNYPLIATNCIKEFALFPVKENLRFVSQETYQSWFRSHPKPGDIIIVNKGTPGLVCFVPYPVDFCIAQDMIAIRTNEKIYNKYLFAYMRSHYFKHQVRGLNVGTTIPHLKKTVFQEIKIPIPDNFDYQKIAGDTYFSLSLKIENLRRQNETLEKIAQTLFKHWFIDFEFPNDDGKPYKSSGGAMVASELGDIPAGWRVGKLGEVADITSSKRIFQSEYQDSGVPFYRSKEIIELSLGQSISTELYISLEKFNEIKEKFSIPQEGDILLTSVGTIGISYIVRKNDFFYFKDGNLTWIKNFRNGFNGILIYFWLKDELTQQQIKVSTIGSTQKALTIQALNNLTLIIYNPLILSKLIPFFVSIYQKFEHNTNQIQTLTKTRDALLPKLMSGQIRIKEAESIIEEVK